MTRVKKATHAIKRRRKLLGKTKGYRFGRKSKEKQAKQAWVRAGQHAFAHRKAKKGDFRRLWQNKIGAAVKAYDLSYSRFIDLLKKNAVGLNRKMLAHLAEHNPDTFERVVQKVSPTNK